MPVWLSKLFYFIALILFLIVAIGTNGKFGVDFLPLGLAFIAAGLLVSGIPIKA